MSRVRKARRLAVGVGAAVALTMATAAPAQAEPPFGQDVHAEVDGALAVPIVAIAPGLEHVFPTGGDGVCNPAGDSGAITGTFSTAHGGVHSIFDPVDYEPAAGDIWVQDDGAICGVIDLDIPEGEFVVLPGATSGDFTLFDVTATVEIIGTGVFEEYIPAGCALSLDIGDLTGTISADGPPNAADLSADGVSIAEASAGSCGDAYSNLLNIGFGLPSGDASISMDVLIHVDDDGHDHDDDDDDDHDHGHDDDDMDDDDDDHGHDDDDHHDH